MKYWLARGVCLVRQQNFDFLAEEEEIGDRISRNGEQEKELFRPWSRKSNRR